MTTNNHNAGSLRYSMMIEWSDEDEAFIVTVPELPGCRTHGSTYEEAVRQAQDAIEGWVESMQMDGGTVPPPKTFTYWSHLAPIKLVPVQVDATQDTPVESRSA